MTTKTDVDASFFVYARDNVTGRVRRVAMPYDVQVGTVDNPTEFMLTGRITFNERVVTVTDNAPIQLGLHDTILTVIRGAVPSQGFISVILPPRPKAGEVHFIVDASTTATETNIVVRGTGDHLINGEVSRTISQSDASLAVYWSKAGEWQLLSVSGGSGSGGADVDASYVVLAATSSLASERVLTAGIGISIHDGGPGGNVTIQNINPSDASASYVVLANTASLPNERALTAGDGIFMVDGGASSTLTVKNVRPGDTFPTYLLLSTTASLPNERAIAEGVGIKFLDGGAHSDFTVFIDNNVVATVSGTRFTGPIIGAGGLTGSLQRLVSGQTYLAGAAGILIATGSTGQITISIDPAVTGDPGASYVVLSATASLSNERVLVVGADLSMITSSTAVTMSNTAGFDRSIPVPLVYLTASVNNGRLLTAGPGISITDFGAGNALRIGLEQFTSQSLAAFQGHCTGSLSFDSTTWTDVHTVFSGSFTDVITSHITRTNSTFTVDQDGYYHFGSNFNANLSSGSHVAFRVSGSAGTLLQHTDWQPIGQGQPNAALSGLLNLTSGSVFKLQYVTSGSGFTWSTPGLVGGPVPDVETARTGEITIFRVANPLVVTQSISNVTTTTTGSGWITAVDINFANLSDSTFVDGNNTLAGIAWRASSVASGADFMGNRAGDGLRIDPNNTNTDNGLTTNTAPRAGFTIGQVIPEWNLDDVEVRVWAQFGSSASSATSLNASQVELGRTVWAADNQNYSFRTRRSANGTSFGRSVSALLGSSQAFSTTTDDAHNVIVMHWRDARHCDFFTYQITSPHTVDNATVWPNISSTLYRGQGDIGTGGLAPTMITGSGDLSFIWSAYTQNTSNNFTASLQRLKVEYRRGVGTGGGGGTSGGGSSGSSGDNEAPYVLTSLTASLPNARRIAVGPGLVLNDYGAGSVIGLSSSIQTSDNEAAYVVLSLTASLPNERILSGGAGIQITDNGPGSTVVISADAASNFADISASYIVTTASALLPHERVLSGNGNFIIDNGSTVSVVNTRPGDTFPTYVVLTATASLANERVLTAGAGISLTDGGAGSTITITNTAIGSGGNGADPSASYVVMGTTASLPNERALTAGSGIQITDGGAGNTVTIASTIQSGADPGAAYIVMSLTGSLNNERVLTAGNGVTITDNGQNNTVVVGLQNLPADISASYIVLSLTGTLPNERRLEASGGLKLVDGGANGSVLLTLNDDYRGAISASYVVVGLTGSLPNERFLSGGSGITITDNGPNGSIVIATDGTGEGDNAASYIVLNATSSLLNERVLTAGSGITLTDNGPGSSLVISSDGGGGGSGFPEPESFLIFSGMKVTDFSVFQTVSAFEFIPTGAETMAPSGSVAYQAYFMPILEVYPTGTIAEARLYNISTSQVVSNSTVTGSSLTPTRAESVNLSGSLQSGSNIYEVQLRVSTTAGNLSRAICKGARLHVVWL